MNASTIVLANSFVADKHRSQEAVAALACKVLAESARNPEWSFKAGFMYEMLGAENCSFHAVGSIEYSLIPALLLRNLVRGTAKTDWSKGWSTRSSWLYLLGVEYIK